MSRYFVLFFLIFIFTPTYAAKIALVIGNGAYNKNYNLLHLDSLDNPVYDAVDLATIISSYETGLSLGWTNANAGIIT